MNHQPIIKKSMAMVFTLVTLLSLITPAIAQENIVSSSGNIPVTLLGEQGPID